MHGILLGVALGAALVAVPSTTPVNALPHGCAAATTDYSAAVDPHARAVGFSVNENKPCTFQFAPGDVFTGSGRFTVSCETGGYYHRPDHAEVEVLPIPQPCAPGAVVTLEGYHLGTGGSVIGGGIGGPELDLDVVAPTSTTDFKPMCAAGLKPAATVSLSAPLDYSGLLRFAGQVTCGGTNVTITSVKVTPLNDYPYPAAGPASCTNCASALTVSGTVPAGWWIYEVAMEFDVTKAGVTVSGQRIGRYLATWAGEIQPVCPRGADESCAA